MYDVFLDECSNRNLFHPWAKRKIDTKNDFCKTTADRLNGLFPSSPKSTDEFKSKKDTLKKMANAIDTKPAGLSEDYSHEFYLFREGISQRC